MSWTLYKDLICSADSTLDIGKTAARWKAIWGDTITGGTLTDGTASLTAGAGTGITTLAMSGVLTNTKADGTAPFTITSTTKVTNLQVDLWDGLHADALTDTRLLRYNSTGTKIENSSVTETSGALGSITTLSMNNQLTNTLAIGTSPFAITSTTVNTNLNADMKHYSDLTTDLLTLAAPNQTVTQTPIFSAGLTTGTLSLSSGSITDSSGAISFGNENLSTTGTLGAGAITGTTVTADGIKLHPAATIVVASSTSRGKNEADYVCDGTADDVQIQAAINALPEWVATPGSAGGEIKLLEGSYSISSTIIIDRAVTITGCGSGGETVLVLANNADCDMFQLNPSASGHPSPLSHFANMMLDGNAANQTPATYAIDQTYNSAYDLYFINIWFNNWKGSSIHLTADYDHRIERCIFENQTTYAIDLERIDAATDTAPMRMWISNCFAPTIYSHGAGTMLCQDLKIDNNIFVPAFDDRTAINLSGVVNLTVTNNSVQGETTTDNTYDWLAIDKATIPGNIIITNNVIRNGKWRYVVNFSGANGSASDSILISNNTFHCDDGTTLIFNDANAIISGLVISGNTLITKNDDSMTAIDVGATNMPIITGNYFRDGAVGVDISDATSDDATIYGNSFDGLTTNISADGDAAHPSLRYGNKNSASDVNDFIIENDGKLQANSAGDDKNIQVYHDDTDGQITTSSGDLKIVPTGDDTLLDSGLTVGSFTQAGDNNLRVEGTSTLVGNVTLSTLTSTRIPFASTNGLLVDSANLNFSTGEGVRSTGTGTFDFQALGTGVIGCGALQNYGSIDIKTYNGVGYVAGIRVTGSGATQEVLPIGSGTGTINLGNATSYWADVSYKTITDRGCLGSFDDGVELQDGSIVSDVEAIKAIKVDPTKQTIYGAPMLDYKTFPKVSYKPADKDGVLLPRDPLTDEPYWIDKEGERKPASDGIEMTSMFSIMLGSIKELDARILEQQKQIDDLKARLDNAGIK